MDYFIAAVVLGGLVVWLWNDVDDTTVFYAVIAVGLAELAADNL